MLSTLPFTISTNIHNINKTKQTTTMIKETYRMEIEIEYEFNDEQISAVDAMDIIDYFAKAEVKLSNENVNILGASLSVINN